MADETTPTAEETPVVAPEDAPTTDTPEDAVPVSEVEEVTPSQPTVVSQEGAQVGDENVAPPREPTVQVIAEDVPAQVAPPRGPESPTVPVHEVAVKLDEVILDPSSPEAVQVPDAGRGSLDLPIHRLAQGRPEDVFAAEAAEAEEEDES